MTATLPRRIGAVLALIVAGCATQARAANGYGKLSGTVLDAAGTPQMGATIWLSSEAAGGAPASQLLSNQSGVFGSSEELVFSMDQSSGRPVVRLVNKETKEVLRQIPPEYLLRLSEDPERIAR